MEMSAQDWKSIIEKRRQETKQRLRDDWNNKVEALHPLRTFAVEIHNAFPNVRERGPIKADKNNHPSFALAIVKGSGSQIDAVELTCIRVETSPDDHGIVSWEIDAHCRHEKRTFNGSDSYAEIHAYL